jgi:hypothetical protein
MGAEAVPAKITDFRHALRWPALRQQAQVEVRVMKRLIAFAAALIALSAALVTAGVSAAPATSLEVEVVPGTLQCGGGASFVFVRGLDAAGNFVAAGDVFLTTSLGAVSPSSGEDTGPGFIAILTAPPTTGGVAVVTAVNEDGLQDTASATVTTPCVALVKEACKDGAWETAVRLDGTGFKSQGDCLQYVNKST